MTMQPSVRVLIAGLLVGLAAAWPSTPVLSQPHKDDPQIPQILSEREQARVIDSWLEERLDTLVLPLMRREGVDMWILIGGEYDEDPVLRTMLPATWLNARRTTILLFHDTGGDVAERLAVARYPVADLFPAAWDPDTQPDQWARLADIVRERDPAAIAINTSADFPLADGLSAGMRRKLETALGSLTERLVERDGLAVGWLEARTEAELALYPHIVRIAHTILAELFSEATITPAVTTTADLRWFLRQRVTELGLDTWFHPSVHIQRAQAETFAIASMGQDGGEVILPGDLLHVDFGITYLRLNTDTQHHAYVLKPGETEAPRGLREGLAVANRVQDALAAAYVSGRSGNDILAAARRSIEAEGITGTIYTHPLGYHGHGAGPSIGMWDSQAPRDDRRGSYPLYPNTVWSIELNAEVAVPEWGGQMVRFMTEEDAVFDGETLRYLDGRQTDITLVPRRTSN